MEKYTLGIDFGTSTTKIAIRRGEEIPIPLQIGSRGELFMPSVVAYRRTADNRAEVEAIGEDATVVPDGLDHQVVREIKRCLATADESVGASTVPYPWWDSHRSCVRLWGSTLTPEDVILRILAEALERAVRRIRELGVADDVDSFTLRGLSARMGCPVSAGLNMRKVLAEVGRRLGFPSFQIRDIVEEPILASVQLAHLDPRPGETILVYDLGGGSFDVAVLRVESGDGIRGRPRLTVLAADGEAFCGGSDVDEALAQHLLHRLEQEHLSIPPAELRAKLPPLESQQLRDLARSTKEALSELQATNVAFPLGFLGTSFATLQVTRAELQSVLATTYLSSTRMPLILSTLECARRAWRRARMVMRFEGEAPTGFYLKRDLLSGFESEPILKLHDRDMKKHIDRVLLVGGASRMPIVRTAVADAWGEDKIVDWATFRPVESAAQGAAWQQEEVGSVVDRIPFSIILHDGVDEHVMYTAFRPTVSYRTRGVDLKVEPYRSSPVRPGKGLTGGMLELRSPEDAPLWQHLLPLDASQPLILSIDAYGQCSLSDGEHELLSIENPSQHELQKELLAKIARDKAEQERRDAQRIADQLGRSVFLEND